MTCEVCMHCFDDFYPHEDGPEDICDTCKEQGHGDVEGKCPKCQERTKRVHEELVARLKARRDAMSEQDQIIFDACRFLNGLFMTSIPQYMHDEYRQLHHRILEYIHRYKVEHYGSD